MNLRWGSVRLCRGGGCWEECSQPELRECEAEWTPARTNTICETGKHDGLPQAQMNDKNTRQTCRRTSSASPNSVRLHYLTLSTIWTTLSLAKSAAPRKQFLQPWRLNQCVASKRRYQPATIHCVKTKQTAVETKPDPLRKVEKLNKAAILSA